MHEELRALLPALESARVVHHAGREFHCGRLDGHEVVLVLSRSVQERVIRTGELDVVAATGTTSRSVTSPAMSGTDSCMTVMTNQTMRWTASRRIERNDRVGRQCFIHSF